MNGKATIIAGSPLGSQKLNQPKSEDFYKPGVHQKVNQPKSEDFHKLVVYEKVIQPKSESFHEINFF